MGRRDGKRKVAKRMSVLLCLMLVCSMWGVPETMAAGKTIFVSQAATGENDGSSWTDAYRELQSALDAVDDGDEIWIAAGIYYPTKDIDGNEEPTDPRTKTFQMKNGVKILGGFPADNENAGMGDRNAKTYETILSGDLNGNKKLDDFDAYHVFYHPQGTFLNQTAVLDGVTVTGGNANSYDKVDAENGGGMLNNHSQPKLVSVKITGNKSLSQGGGIYNESSNLIFEGGSIDGNTAGSGGGMYASQGSIFLKNAEVKNNEARYEGGGIFVSNSAMNLENVEVSMNTTLQDGGGLATIGGEVQLTSVKLTDNKARNGGGIHVNSGDFKMKGGEIKGNTAAGDRAGNGGGAYISYGWDSTFEGVTIENNTAQTGGGVYDARGSFTYINTSITNNNAVNGAGAAIFGGQSSFVKSVVSNNTAKENGGGVLINTGSPSFKQIIISSNKAKNGAGIYTFEGLAELLNSEIKGNQSTANGGAVFNYNSKMDLTNSIVSGNAAANGGGFYNNSVSDSKLINLTITGNSAEKGGALFNSASNPVIQNSILWENANAVHNSGLAPTFAHSIVQGSGGSENWDGAFGKNEGGNLDTDPKFTSPVPFGSAPVINGDFRLTEGSPAVDAGKNDYVPEKVERDLDGNYRIMGANVDLGAYEILQTDEESPVWERNTYLNAYTEDEKSIRLHWLHAKDNYGVEGYRIYMNDELIYDLKKEQTEEYYQPEYVVSGLQPSTVYKFAVEAYDEAGNTSKRLTIRASTGQEPDDETPTWSKDAKLSFSEEGSGVNISWPEAQDNKGIDHYLVSIENATWGIDELTINIHDLKPDTEYEFELVALDFQGNESKPLVQKYKTLPIWSDNTQVEFSETVEFGPVFSWTETKSGLVRNYEIAINGKVERDYYIGDKFQAWDLLPNTEYEFTLTPVDYQGKKFARALTKKVKTLPVWPENSKLTFSDIDQSGLSVQWPASESGLVRYYEIMVDDLYWSSVGRNQTDDYIYGLEPGTEYTFKVRAFDWNDNLVQELQAKTKTAPYSDLEPPYWNWGVDELKVNEIKETSMKVNWPEAMDNEGVKGYRILVDNKKVADVKASATSYEITGLTKGTTYTIVVQAYDEKGNTANMRIGVQTASGGEGGTVIVLPPTPSPVAPPKPDTPVNPGTPGTPGQPPAPVPNLVDVKGHWAERQIKEGLERRLISGYLDDTFRPDNQINRAEFTIILANALGLSGEGKALDFTDNREIGASSRLAVQRAVEAGVVKGFSDGSFRPQQRITRMEMAAMIARAMDLEGNSSAHTGFADDSSIPQWARAEIGAMKATGIITGRGNNRFEPTVNATRAETIVMVLRMVKYQEQ